jgi:hypothetical protein
VLTLRQVIFAVDQRLREQEHGTIQFGWKGGFV